MKRKKLTSKNSNDFSWLQFCLYELCMRCTHSKCWVKILVMSYSIMNEIYPNVSNCLVKGILHFIRWQTMSKYKILAFFLWHSALCQGTLQTDARNQHLKIKNYSTLLAWQNHWIIPLIKQFVQVSPKQTWCFDQNREAKLTVSSFVFNNNKSIFET